jgi:hypothetical protein
MKTNYEPSNGTRSDDSSRLRVPGRSSAAANRAAILRAYRDLTRAQTARSAGSDVSGESDKVRSRRAAATLAMNGYSLADPNYALIQLQRIGLSAQYGHLVRPPTTGARREALIVESEEYTRAQRGFDWEDQA